MYDLKEKEEKKQNDEYSYSREVYRRGARNETKGNFTLAVVVVLLAAVVVFGIFFAVKVFFSTEDLLGNKAAKKDEKQSMFYTDTDENLPQSGSFSVKCDENKKFVFENKVLNFAECDIDSDGEMEKVSVGILKDGSIDISVYEMSESGYVRNGYYMFSENIFENEDDFKNDIYITESGEKTFICAEYFSDKKWDLTVFEYEGEKITLSNIVTVKNGNYPDDIYDKLEKYSVKYCGKDYTDSVLNSKTGTLLCAFVKKGETVSCDI